MNCKNCGYLLSNDDQFCKNCGAAVMGEQAPSVPSFSVVDSGSNTPNVNAFQQEPANNFSQSTVSNVQPVMNQQPVMGMQQMAPQQAMPYQQPYVGNSMNYNQTPKNDNSKYIILGIVISVVVAIVAVALVLIFKDDNNQPAGSPEGNNTNTPTPTVSQTGTEISFSGYSLIIPKELNYDKEFKNGTEYLFIGDADETWVARAVLLEGSFNNLKKNKSQLSVNAQKNGYTTNPAQASTYNGVEFVTMETAISGTKDLFVYGKLDNSNILAMDLFSVDNSYDYDALNKIAAVIKTAKYGSGSQGLKPTSEFDASIIIEDIK